MTVATVTKVVPLISSGTAGPLGAIHLPRLWSKLMLGNAGLLPEDYDYCGSGFDQMTIDNLGLDRGELIEFVKQNKPTYIQFEEYVRTHGKTDPQTIQKHNVSIRSYNHSDEKCGHVREEIGLNDTSITDAVTLNNLDDLQTLHTMLGSAG